MVYIYRNRNWFCIQFCSSLHLLCCRICLVWFVVRCLSIRQTQKQLLQCIINVNLMYILKLVSAFVCLTSLSKLVDYSLGSTFRFNEYGIFTFYINWKWEHFCEIGILQFPWLRIVFNRNYSNAILLEFWSLELFAHQSFVFLSLNKSFKPQASSQ